MNDRMPSMQYSTSELNQLLKFDPRAPIINRLREASVDTDVNVDSSSREQVNLITKEVLKACNVIRPSVMDLTNLPQVRAEHKKAHRNDMRIRKTFSSSIGLA